MHIEGTDPQFAIVIQVGVPLPDQGYWLNE